MDSLTQFTVGAAIGEAVLGRENYVVTFKVYKETGRTRIDAVRKVPNEPGRLLRMLWSRIWGNE